MNCVGTTFEEIGSRLGTLGTVLPFRSANGELWFKIKSNSLSSGSLLAVTDDDTEKLCVALGFSFSGSFSFLASSVAVSKSSAHLPFSVQSSMSNLLTGRTSKESIVRRRFRIEDGVGPAVYVWTGELSLDRSSILKVTDRQRFKRGVSAKIVKSPLFKNDSASSSLSILYVMEIFTIR